MLNISRCALPRQAQWDHAHVRSSFQSWGISKACWWPCVKICHLCPLIPTRKKERGWVQLTRLLPPRSWQRTSKIEMPTRQRNELRSTIFRYMNTFNNQIINTLMIHDEGYGEPTQIHLTFAAIRQGLMPTTWSQPVTIEHENTPTVLRFAEESRRGVAFSRRGVAGETFRGVSPNATSTYLITRSAGAERPMHATRSCS